MSTPDFDPRLYLVAGSDDVDHRGLDNIVRQAVEGGVTLFQLREKTLATGAFIEAARSLRDALRGTGVRLLINDRVDVALAANVDGVHIGQDDIAPRDARKLLGEEKLIGLTVRDADEISQAPIAALDYLSIGGVFPTASKNNTREPVGLDGLTRLASQARDACRLPVTAIAGISKDTARSVMDCGVDGIAVISSVCAQPDPASAAGALREIIDASLEGRQRQ